MNIHVRVTRAHRGEESGDALTGERVYHVAVGELALALRAVGAARDQRRGGASR